MSLKDKIASFFFSSNSKEEETEELFLEEQPAPSAAPESPETVIADPSLLEIPADHPIRSLCELWKTQSGQAPGLRLSMDEDGALPSDLVSKEKNRLQSSLKSVCSSRWKSTKGRVRGKHNKKKAEEEDEPIVLDARPWFFLSSDKLCAWMLVFPPVGEGAELSREMLQQSLSAQGICFGLDMALLDRLLHGRDRYFTLYLVARGKPAFDGRNGNIVDYFPRVIERVLDVNEFGQVDYTALNLICNVTEGQEICRLIRPTEGEPGRNVLDQEVPAKSGASVPLPKGRNTEISEDGDSLVATMPGHVEFSGHSFQVKPVLDIDGDVDFSTGNINFVGDVNIKGDVISGFSVRAMGNVYVGGVVEAGSTVEAGGDLTVVKGILGDGSTAIRASRCIFSKYIENSIICAKENLQTDCIVNSKIYCDGDVVVRSGRGSIMGGRTWAGKKVSANAIGAKSEIRTAVSMGGTPCASFERETLRKELKELDQELERLENQLDSPAKSSLMGKVRMKISVAEHKLSHLDEDAKEEQEEENNSRMEFGVAYAGTEIRFGDAFLRLRQESRHCTAKLVCDEIVLI